MYTIKYLEYDKRWHVLLDDKSVAAFHSFSDAKKYLEKS